MMENPLPIGREVRRRLEAHGLRPLKRFGQHFLTNADLCDRIADAADLGPEKTVLEVGGGLGILTEALAHRATRVVSIELDRGLLPLLREQVSAFSHVEVVEGDALKLPLEQLVNPGTGAVVANLPYYATSPLLARFLRLGYDPIVVMIQKEVAQRLGAPPGGKEYGALTLLASYYAQVDRLFTVPPSAFYPPPEVESAVVRLKRKRGVGPPPPLFFPLVRWAFRYRRKSLGRALAEGSGQPVAKTGRLLQEAGCDPMRRGETLSLQEFQELAARLEGLIQGGDDDAVYQPDPGKDGF